MPPRSRAAVFETAEEAGAVLPVQTLVAVLLVALLHVRGVVHLNGRGRARADVYCGGLLFQDRRKGHPVSNGRGFHSDLAAKPTLSWSCVAFHFYEAAKCNLHLQLGAF